MQRKIRHTSPSVACSHPLPFSLNSQWPLWLSLIVPLLPLVKSICSNGVEIPTLPPRSLSIVICLFVCLPSYIRASIHETIIKWQQRQTYPVIRLNDWGPGFLLKTNEAHEKKLGKPKPQPSHRCKLGKINGQKFDCSYASIKSLLNFRIENFIHLLAKLLIWSLSDRVAIMGLIAVRIWVGNTFNPFVGPYASDLSASDRITWINLPKAFPHIKALLE